jgi:hypothetical protein
MGESFFRKLFLVKRNNDEGVDLISLAIEI